MKLEADGDYANARAEMQAASVTCVRAALDILDALGGGAGDGGSISAWEEATGAKCAYAATTISAQPRVSLKLDEDFDLLICGKMAVDGDTAQIGPELAGAFEIPCVTDVSCVQSAGFTTCGSLALVHGCDAGEETVYLEMPCAMTTAKEIGQLRMPSIAGIRAAEEADVRVVNAADVNADPARCGLAGSPTQVVRSFVPDRNQTCEAVDGTASEQAAKLAKIIEGMA